MRRGVSGWFASVVTIALLAWPMSLAARSEFPYERELLLDAAPMKGSKRVPSLDIAADGAAEIVLWCNTVRAQLVVAGNTITIITGPSSAEQCPPERLRGDEDLLAALTQATHWRREGDYLILTGGRSLRFHLQTN